MIFKTNSMSEIKLFSNSWSNAHYWNWHKTNSNDWSNFWLKCGSWNMPKAISSNWNSNT